jgi:hypothetical protein
MRKIPTRSTSYQLWRIGDSVRVVDLTMERNNFSKQSNLPTLYKLRQNRSFLSDQRVRTPRGRCESATQMKSGTNDFHGTAYYVHLRRLTDSQYNVALAAGEKLAP